MYGAEQARHYLEANPPPEETIETWLALVEPYVAASRRPTILDLGAGTGVFAGPLQRRFNADVIAVDASIDMLTHSCHPIPRVRRVVGDARAIPVRTGTVDLVFVSRALHHFHDLRGCGHQMARVLKPRGSLVIRGGFADRLHTTPLYTFFPEARTINKSLLPRLTDVCAFLTEAGFKLEDSKGIREAASQDLLDYERRIRTRSLTTLRLMNEKDYRQGLAALSAATQDSAGSRPVYETIHFLAFRSHAEDGRLPCDPPRNSN